MRPQSEQTCTAWQVFIKFEGIPCVVSYKREPEGCTFSSCLIVSIDKVLPKSLLVPFASVPQEAEYPALIPLSLLLSPEAICHADREVEALRVMTPISCTLPGIGPGTGAQAALQLQLQHDFVQYSELPGRSSGIECIHLRQANLYLGTKARPLALGWLLYRLLDGIWGSASSLARQDPLVIAASGYAVGGACRGCRGPSARTV